MIAPLASKAVAAIDTLPLSRELVLLILVVVSIALGVRNKYSHRPNVPSINKPGFWTWNRKPFVHRFAFRNEELINQGFQKGKAFMLYTDAEPHLVLAPEYSEEVKAHPDLSFRAYTQTVSLSTTRGLEPFHEGAMEDGLGPEVVKAKLNHQLGIVTAPLSQTAREGLHELWTDNAEWHTVSVRHTIAHLIAKLSTRVFLGEQLAHNADLESVIVNYTHVGFEAIMELKKWSPILRPVVHWFIPQVRASRQMIKHARELLRPEQERRKREKAQALAEGKPSPKYPDTLTWAEEVAKRPYDPVALQLGLSLAAVHTTADLLGQAVINLCHYPEWVQPLREEVTTILVAHGMNKNSITKLHLLDSFLKETQRLKPIQRIFLQRQATKLTKLKDGLTIPKGQMLAVPVTRMTDESIHSDAQKFDPKRFVNMRSIAGKENSAHLVSCTPDHIAFGLGRYACPGRFFAAHEVKIAMSHIILKYDVKFAKPDEAALPLNYGITSVCSPTAELSVRRREPELDIDSIMA